MQLDIWTQNYTMHRRIIITVHLAGTIKYIPYSKNAQNGQL